MISVKDPWRINEPWISDYFPKKMALHWKKWQELHLAMQFTFSVISFFYQISPAFLDFKYNSKMLLYHDFAGSKSFKVFYDSGIDGNDFGDSLENTKKNLIFP